MLSKHEVEHKIAQSKLTQVNLFIFETDLKLMCGKREFVSVDSLSRIYYLSPTKIREVLHNYQRFGWKIEENEKGVLFT